MAKITFRISDALFDAVNDYASELGISRSEVVRRAIAYRLLEAASEKVREESLAVLAEFEAIAD